MIVLRVIITRNAINLTEDIGVRVYIKLMRLLIFGKARTAG